MNVNSEDGGFPPDIDLLLEQMIQSQQKTLLQCARRIVPSATSDDILQPNDFPALENHPYFRYEEGILAGLQSAQMAIRANSLRLENQKSAESLAAHHSFLQEPD